MFLYPHTSPHSSVSQLALDAPRLSLVGMAAASSQAVLSSVGARMMTKEDHWPALLMTLQGCHTDIVLAVAYHEGLGVIASASADATLRCE